MTIEFLLAVGLSLIVLTAMVNLIVFEYGRGVVRNALDEGVRAGARAGLPQPACEQTANQVLSDLLGGRSGSMGRAVSVACAVSTSGSGVTVVSASATGRFRAWFRPLPDMVFTVTASAVQEPPTTTVGAGP